MSRLALEIPVIAKMVNRSIFALTVLFAILTVLYGQIFLIGLIPFGLLLLANAYVLYVQKDHAILRNFGLFGIMRYMIESIGPELRQYLYASDTEERPFNRADRSEVYRKAKDIDSASSFGSQDEFDHRELKLRHSFFPLEKEDLVPYQVTFGEERKLKSAYTISKPIMISAMSYGALGQNAVRALSRGAKKAGIPMNTGEGGYPKYHLMEGSDIIFQMGTAKFGCRNKDSSLNDEKLKEIAKLPQVKMIEIKFSQGAKPGKGGLLPKEKITKEISELRHVEMGEDVISPPRHVECTNAQTTVQFIERVQNVVQIPVGIKFCLGNPEEFNELVKEMKKKKVFPDYIVVDGAQGGTGAAPKSFMDDVGTPVYPALQTVQNILVKEGVRNKLKLIASGKLINPGKQMIALTLGADAIYSARGFMLSLGCIQALQCNKNTCPVGITTHDKKLQHGLDIENKSTRVANYVKNLDHEFYELMSSMGCKKVTELHAKHLYVPEGQPLSSCVH